MGTNHEKKLKINSAAELNPFMVELSAFAKARDPVRPVDLRDAAFSQPATLDFGASQIDGAYLTWANNADQWELFCKLARLIVSKASKIQQWKNVAEK